MAFTTRATGQQITPACVNDFANALTGAMTDQAYTLNYRPASLGTVPTLLLKQNGNAPLLKGLKSDDTTQAFLFSSTGGLTLADVLSPKTTAASSNTFVGSIDFGNGSSIGVFGSANVDLQFLSNGTMLVKGSTVTLKGTGGNIAQFQDSAGTNKAIVDSGGNMSFLGNGAFAKIGRDGSSNFYLDNPSGTRMLGIAATTGVATFVGAIQAPSYKNASGGPAAIAVYDNGTGTLRTITLYEGATDPATYATPQEGDWWLKG